MTKKTSLLAALAAFVALPLAAQTTAYDGFDVPGDYADALNMNGASGGTGWAGAWSVLGNGATDPDTKFFAEAGGLSYGDLVTTDGNLDFNGGSFDRATRLFSATNIGSDTFYFGFIWNDGSIFNVNDSFAIVESSGFERYRVDNDGTGQFRLYVNMVGGGAGFITAAGTTAGLDASQPVLIVVELLIGTANDTFTVYFNPSDLNDIAGSAQQTLVATESDANTEYGGSFQNSIAGVRFNSTADTNNKFDEIRVAYNGATIADVVPAVEPIVYEGFDVPGDYTDTVSLNGLSGGTDWRDAWTDASDEFEAIANGLSYLDLSTTDGALQKKFPSGFGSTSRHFREDSSFSGTIYFSTIVQNGVSDNVNDVFFVLDQNTFGQQRFRLRNDGTGELAVEVKLGGGSGSHELLGTTDGLDLSQPTLIVGELVLGTAVDTLTVYINPSDLGDVAGTAAHIISGNETEFTGNFSQDISTYGVGSTARANVYDEVRIAYLPGSTMADVLPRDPTLVYDGFDSSFYPNNTSVNALNGGNNWADAWTDVDGDDFLAQFDGLSYLDLQTTAGRVEKATNGTFGTLRRHFRATGSYSGTIYFSILFQGAGSDDIGNNYLILDQGTFGQERFRIANDGSGQLLVSTKLVGGIGSQETIGTTSGLDISQPTLIVGELTLGTGTDSITLYFNPTDLSDVAGTATQTISGSETSFTGSFATDISTFAVQSIGSANTFDEIRIGLSTEGETLESVVPIEAADLIASDEFAFGGGNEYAAGYIEGQNPVFSGQGWNGAWQEVQRSGSTQTLNINGNDLPIYSDGSLRLQRIAPEGNTGSIRVTDTTGAADDAELRRTFSDSDLTGDIYFSFLVEIGRNAGAVLAGGSRPSTTWGINLHDASGDARYEIRADRTNDLDPTSVIDSVQVGINPVGGSVVYSTASSIAFTAADFIVGRISGAGSSDTTFDLWVNPSDLSNISALTPDTTVNVNTLTSAGVASLQIQYSYDDDSGNSIDELRIGRSFSQVVPIEAANSKPEITDISLSGTTLTVTLNGAPNEVFNVFSTTDLTSPLSTPVTTNPASVVTGGSDTVGGLGTTSFDVTVDPGTIPQFFLNVQGDD